jgi:MFS transporter, DHA1 family, inner membrane transport protein
MLSVLEASQNAGRLGSPAMSAAREQRATSSTIISAIPVKRSAEIGFVVLLGISYLFNSMDRQVFPALLSAIVPRYGLTLPQAGFVSAVFTIMVAIFGALSGWFMGKFGRKAVLVGGLIAYSAFTFATPLANGFVTLATYRTLTGAGEALQVGAIFACLGSYFGKRRGTFMGVVQAFFGAGALLGPVVGARLFIWSGAWEIPFYVFGAAGFLMALIVTAAVPRHFSDTSKDAHVDRAAYDTKLPVLLSRNLLLMAAAFSLIGTSFFSYTALYATYLHNDLGFSITAASASLGMYGLGALGALIGGWLGERLGRLGVAACFFVVAATGFALFNLATSEIAHAALSLLFGLMISGILFARLMSMLQLSAHPAKIGAAVAFGLGGFYAPGPFAGYLFGKLVVQLGWGAGSDFMIVLPAVIAAALVSLFDMRAMSMA